MPDYFLYLGSSGVNNWLALSESDEFPITARLTELLRQSLPSLTMYLRGRFSLVSIGVGSGEKERMLLEALVPRSTPTYYAVDISREMVDQALNRVADINVEKIGLVALLEDLALIRQYWSPPILLCLLGNNFGAHEPDWLLETVHAQLKGDDMFLFDCHLLPASRRSQARVYQQVQQMYRVPSNLRFNLEPLIRRGMEPDSGIFHADLVPVKTGSGTLYGIKKWLEITKDSVIHCGASQVFLKAGDTINRGVTYKCTRSQIADYLNRHGFQESAFYLSPDENYLLTLVRKQPHF